MSQRAKKFRIAYYHTGELCEVCVFKIIFQDDDWVPLAKFGMQHKGVK